MRKLLWLALFAAVIFPACITVEPLHKFKSMDLSGAVKKEVDDFVSASVPDRGIGSAGHDKAFIYLKTQFESIAADAIKNKGRAKVIIHEFEPDVDFAVRNYENDFNTLIKPRYSPKDPTYKKWSKFTRSAIGEVSLYKNTTGRNVILEIAGRRAPSEVVYVGAHYDTIIHNRETLEIERGSNAPGADDNGSGIGALLLMAREMSKDRPDRTVRFVAFDFEEVFFLGSFALAKDLSSQRPRWMRTDEQTVGLVNLEMIGWSTKAPEHPVLKIYTREKKVAGSEQDNSMSAYFRQAARLLKSPLKIVFVANGFNRSDNWSFWQKSFPSLCVSEDWESDFNPHYHAVDDTPDTLNTRYLGAVTNLLIETVTEMTHITQQAQ